MIEDRCGLPGQSVQHMNTGFTPVANAPLLGSVCLSGMSKLKGRKRTNPQHTEGGQSFVPCINKASEEQPLAYCCSRPFMLALAAYVNCLKADLRPLLLPVVFSPGSHSLFAALLLRA